MLESRLLSSLDSSSRFFFVLKVFPLSRKLPDFDNSYPHNPTCNPRNNFKGCKAQLLLAKKIFQKFVYFRSLGCDSVPKSVDETHIFTRLRDLTSKGLDEDLHDEQRTWRGLTWRAKTFVYHGKMPKPQLIKSCLIKKRNKFIQILILKKFQDTLWCENLVKYFS